MKRYTVRSTFKDAKGRDLFHSKTFDGTAEDARCALVDAHAEMARLGAADGRVDSISSVVSGPNEEISTTDYLDELGSGASTSGLMQEVAPEDLEPRRTPTIDPVRDGFAPGGLIGNPTEQGSIYKDIFENPKAATGGEVQPHDTFRAVGLGGAEGIDQGAASSEPLSGEDDGKGWADPRSNPLADIHAGRRRIEEASEYGLIGNQIVSADGVPGWLTPPVRDFRSPNADTTQDYHLGAGKAYIDHKYRGNVKEFKIKITDHDTPPFVKTRKTVGDIIKESRRAGKPTMREVMDAYLNIKPLENHNE